MKISIKIDNNIKEKYKIDWNILFINLNKVNKYITKNDKKIILQNLVKQLKKDLWIEWNIDSNEIVNFFKANWIDILKVIKDADVINFSWDIKNSIKLWIIDEKWLEQIKNKFESKNIFIEWIDNFLYIKKIKEFKNIIKLIKSIKQKNN